MIDFLLFLYFGIAAVLAGAFIVRFFKGETTLVPPSNATPGPTNPSKQPSQVDEEPAYEMPQNNYKPVAYDQDDTYDNFYMQCEEEYRQEYGDDAEDAVDDAWDERHGR